MYTDILLKNDFSSSPVSPRTVVVDISRLEKGPFSMQYKGARPACVRGPLVGYVIFS